MKKGVITLFTLFGVSLSIYANAGDFASLAVDRSNGFIYGWSRNQPSLYAAERGALDECNKATSGYGCSVVLAWYGGGCGAYRTIDSQFGTAYGWGVAATKDIADKLAYENALKRSNGIIPSNYVWACNTNKNNQIRIIKPRN